MRRQLDRIRLLTAATVALGACSLEPRPAGEDFEVAAGLELTVWASEPLLVNPTNFDIDERGRVWFIESVNYRSDLKGRPRTDLEGDRIVILADTDGDGLADSRRVFDQHPDMLAPLGIAVLGSKVVVSQSPDLIVYTKDEDDRIVSKETLLSGWAGVDHDHGLHAIVFGPDGRYYFNSGDRGFETTDRSGDTYRSSKQGPYYAATVQSVRPDGTDFRVLAHNARNPYEVALDSFGTIWQTDNDDDGNQWTRLLHVMEGANFGYWGPGGRRWREDRGTHFHEERPDTYPYVARTGPGSPTGLVVYEGDLLPLQYRGQLLHAEPGKRLIQTFLLSPDGAGYSMAPENTVVSTDPLFRPSDLAVAPDGSVFIADWQDPVVGGHNMLDVERGRILRLAPAGHRSTLPELDLGSDEGVLAAFASPNQATRYRAYEELLLRDEADRAGILARAWSAGGVASARALWLLAALGEAGSAALEESISSADARFRILALRVARLHGLDFRERLNTLAEDPDARVRAEAAVMLRDASSEVRVPAWLELARRYDGKDRWYLAALGIGARGAEDELFKRLSSSAGEWSGKLAHLYRVLRAPSSLPLLARVATSGSAPATQRLQALEALGWMGSAQAARTVAGLAASPQESAAIRNRALYFLGKQLFSEWSDYRGHADVIAAVNRAIESVETRSQALELAGALASPALAPALKELAADTEGDEADRATAIRSLGAVGGDGVAELLAAQVRKGPPALRIAAIEGLRAQLRAQAEPVLAEVILSDAPNEVRTAALRALGRAPSGQRAILGLERSQELPAELRAPAATIVNSSRDRDIRAAAAEVLPPPKSRNDRPVVRVREIVEGVGSVERGRAEFEREDGANCAKCHSLAPGEELVGPSLAAIASKYGKEGMLNAILHPSEGIAPEYVTWILDTSTHGLVTGILIEDSDERVVLRTEAADELRLRPADIVERRKAKLSIMPEDLVSAMTTQQLIDLIEFLATLRRAG